MLNPHAIRLRVPIFSIVVAIALGGCGGAHARYEHHMARGKQYLTDGNLDKAGIELRNALQIQPKNPEALYLSGRVAEQRGAIPEAVGLYQAAIEIKPDNEQARASLGRIFVFAGGPKQALEVIEPGLAKHPDSPELLAGRGAARHQMNDDSGARADAERAVQLAPTDENALGLLAAIYSETGDEPRAVALVNGALHQVPDSIGLREVLARLYLKSNQRERAEEQMRKLIELQPQQLPPRLRLALFYASTARPDDSQRVLEGAVRALPKNDEAKLALVDFIATKRTRAEGEKQLRGFIAQDPDNFDLRLGLGALLQRAGALKEALAVYEDTSKRAGDAPKGLVARDRIAAIDAAHGRYDEALKVVAEVLRKNPNDSDALILRGNIALEQQDTTSAISDLRAVLRDQPNAVGVKRALARAYLAQGEQALAEETLRGAMEATPGDNSIRIDLAQLLGQTKRGDQAVALLEQAVHQSPSDSTLREALARAYIATQNLKAAQTAVHDLEMLEPNAPIGPFLAGVIAQNQNRLDDSQKAFEQALALKPTALETLAALSKLQLARGQGAVARERLQAVVDAEPANALTRNLLAEILIATKAYPEAFAQLTKAIETAPKWPVPYHNLAGAKSSSGDLPGATAVCETALQSIPFEPTLVADLAALYERQGRVNDAIARYESLYSHNPRLDLAANNLAVLLVTYRKDQRSLDRARDLSAKFATSENGALLDTNGWVHFKRGEITDALPVLERALERVPDSRVIRYHLALAELQVGQRERARTNLETALSGSGSFSGADDARSILASLKGRAG